MFNTDDSCGDAANMDYFTGLVVEGVYVIVLTRRQMNVGREVLLAL